jgi:hypothetical protein
MIALAMLGAAALSAVPCSHAGKLDLDIYATTPRISSERPAGPTAPLTAWVPGDPRDLRDDPRWVKHLSHVGYAGLGVAGLAGSIATGGVAPAIGFGLVALVQSFLEWRELKDPASGKAD